MARILASRFERAAHLEADDFFRFIRSGFVEPWMTGSQGQNEVVMGIVGDAATSYASAGYFTIVDGIILPGWFYEPLHNRLRNAGLEVDTAILRASLGTCMERARIRSPSLADPAVVEQLWQGFSSLGALEGRVIETDHQEPVETADAVINRWTR